MNTIPNFRGFWNKSVSGGRSYLFGLGYNDYGILGFAPITSIAFGTETLQLLSSPVQITTLSSWKKVEIAENRTTSSSYGSNLFGLMESGHLVGMGLRSPLMMLSTSSNTKNVPVLMHPDSLWNDFSLSCSMHVLGIKNNNTLWAWGNNLAGQLGQGITSTTISSPVQIGTQSDWIKASVSGIQSNNAVSFAIRSPGATSITHGSLWAWGSNTEGQLGIGTTANAFSPVQVGGQTSWIDVFPFIDRGTADITFALQRNGTLWAWGRNNSGMLGVGNTVSRSSPVQVGALTDWVKAQSANELSIGLRRNGTLWGWGNIGTAFGTVTSSSSPIQIGTATDWKNFSLFSQGRELTELFEYGLNNEVLVVMKNNGTIWVIGDNNPSGVLGRRGQIQPEFLQIGSASDWIKVEAAIRSSFGIRQSGTLWAWGSNDSPYTVLGLGDSVFRSIPVQIGSLTGWTDVTSSGNHALALRSNGTLWAWGRNTNGQLGLGNTTARSSPVQIGTDTNWASIASFNGEGEQFSAAIRTNGTLWAWGQNSFGELGIGTTVNASSPVQIGSGTTGPWSKVCCGSNFMLAITTEGQLWAWGGNGSGRLGIGNTTNRSSPVQVGGLTGWKDVQAGNGFTNALRDNNTLWGWGSGQYNGIGSFVSSPVQIGTNTDWNTLSVGNCIGAAIKTNGTLWAWGEPSPGQIDGGNTRKNSPVQVGTDTDFNKVSIVNDSTLNDGHLLIIKNNGTLWGRGRNWEGQIGPNFVRSVTAGAGGTGFVQILGLTASLTGTSISKVESVPTFAVIVQK